MAGGTETATGRYSLVARFSALCERPEVNLRSSCAWPILLLLTGRWAGDRMTELHEAFRLALERIAAEGRLAPGWTGETAAEWAWARMQPGSWATLVGMRGWDPREYTERTVGSLMAELVTAPGQLPISARSGHQVFTRT